jgi:hypothetical protein
MIRTQRKRKLRGVHQDSEGVDVMRDKKLKLEDLKSSHALGGAGEEDT